jgi:peptidoglycan hydrolase CwlO-like protein
VGQEWRSIRQQIGQLQDQEKEILAGLLEATSALRQQEEKVHRLRSQVEEARRNLQKAREQALLAQQRYLTARDHAGRQLRIMQQAGPGSYLDLILAADSWSDLLRRWRLATDLVQGTLRLLRDLAQDRDRWRDRLAVVEQKQQSLEAKLQEATRQEEALRAVVSAREELLASLGPRRSYFEERLRALETLVANEARPLLEELSATMARADLPGSMSEGPVRLQPTPQGWQVAVGEAVLQAALRGHRGHTFTVALQDGRTVIVAPGHDMRVEGRFVPARGGTAAALEVDAVRVAGVDLGAEAVRWLCRDLHLAIDLRPLLPPGLSVQAIASVPGWLHVTVGASTEHP